jgi:Serine endopeptidase inhibitors
MKKNNSKKPFFAKFLENQQEVTGGAITAINGDIAITLRYPSDKEGPVTLKYPSDDDEFVTLKAPSDDDENVTLKYPSDNDEGGIEL